MSPFLNAYADPDRAASYATLAFPATYSLAFRDLPALFEAHGVGTRSDGPAGPDRGSRPGRRRRALDFGCGAGRSTRFLLELGYDVVGVDISDAMLARARSLDDSPGATDRYRLIDDDPAALPAGPFELVLAAYPFDNIPGIEHRVALLAGLRQRLADAGEAGVEGRGGGPGRLVLIASSPELYVHEWATFTTADWPENADAGSGDRVRIAIKDVGDGRPVDDILWLDDDYRNAFDRAGLEVLEVHRPLATGQEGVDWINETEIAPWVIYVAGTRGAR